MFNDLKNNNLFADEENPFNITNDLELNNPFSYKQEVAKQEIDIPKLNNKTNESILFIEKRLKIIMNELNQVFSKLKELKEELNEP